MGNHKIEDGVFFSTYKNTIHTQLLYITIITSCIIGLVLLPFIKIQISIKGAGLLQSSSEKTSIICPVNGRLIKHNLRDNKIVSPGDLLLVVDPALVNEQGGLNQQRLTELNQLQHDLNILLSTENTDPSDLNTGLYRASLQQYFAEKANARSAKEMAEKNYQRFEKLYKAGVLTTAEYEKYQFEKESATASLTLVEKKYKTQWEHEKGQISNEIRQLNSQQAEMKEQRKQFVLRAPLAGSLQNVAGISRGSYVFANQKLAEISPKAELQAYCYIKPADIGLIYLGQQVRFQVDAFNYNQWGVLSGKVSDISDDIILLNDQEPVFKVKCNLDQTFLQLKNGYKGYIRKGMNFTARFLVAERSLFQLMYDKLDNWVNPNLAAHKTN